METPPLKIILDQSDVIRICGHRFNRIEETIVFGLRGYDSSQFVTFGSVLEALGITREQALGIDGVIKSRKADRGHAPGEFCFDDLTIGYGKFLPWAQLLDKPISINMWDGEEQYYYCTCYPDGHIEYGDKSIFYPNGRMVYFDDKGLPSHEEYPTLPNTLADIVCCNWSSLGHLQNPAPQRWRNCIINAQSDLEDIKRTIPTAGPFIMELAALVKVCENASDFMIAVMINKFIRVIITKMESHDDMCKWHSFRNLKKRVQ